MNQTQPLSTQQIRNAGCENNRTFHSEHSLGGAKWASVASGGSLECFFLRVTDSAILPILSFLRILTNVHLPFRRTALICSKFSPLSTISNCPRRQDFAGALRLVRCCFAGACHNISVPRSPAGKGEWQMAGVDHGGGDLGAAKEITAGTGNRGSRGATRSPATSSFSTTSSATASALEPRRLGAVGRKLKRYAKSKWTFQTEKILRSGAQNTETRRNREGLCDAREHRIRLPGIR
jgi:hypothetical protein